LRNPDWRRKLLEFPLVEKPTARIVEGEFVEEIFRMKPSALYVNLAAKI